MTIIQLFINVLSVFRMANLFYEEDGPYKIFELIRERSGLFIYQTNNGVVKNLNEPDGNYNFFGNLLSCFWCISIYISLFVYILDQFKLGKILNIVMAFSAASILIKEKLG